MKDETNDIEKQIDIALTVASHKREALIEESKLMHLPENIPEWLDMVSGWLNDLPKESMQGKYLKKYISRARRELNNPNDLRLTVLRIYDSLENAAVEKLAIDTENYQLDCKINGEKSERPPNLWAPEVVKKLLETEQTKEEGWESIPDNPTGCWEFEIDKYDFNVYRDGQKLVCNEINENGAVVKEIGVIEKSYFFRYFYKK